MTRAEVVDGDARKPRPPPPPRPAATMSRAAGRPRRQDVKVPDPEGLYTRRVRAVQRTGERWFRNPPPRVVLCSMETHRASGPGTAANAMEATAAGQAPRRAVFIAVALPSKIRLLRVIAEAGTVCRATSRPPTPHPTLHAPQCLDRSDVFAIGEVISPAVPMRHQTNSLWARARLELYKLPARVLRSNSSAWCRLRGSSRSRRRATGQECPARSKKLPSAACRRPQ